MLLGGLLTQYVSWRWVLFVNVPVAALVLAATPRLIPDDRGQPGTTIDLPGAVTVTGGLLAVVYATTQVPANGWTGSQTVGLFLLAAILLGAFVAVEARHRAPLVPLSTFRRRSLAGAGAVGVLVGAGLVGPPIFFLTPVPPADPRLLGAGRRARLAAAGPRRDHRLPGGLEDGRNGRPQAAGRRRAAPLVGRTGHARPGPAPGAGGLRVPTQEGKLDFTLAPGARDLPLRRVPPE